MDLNYLYHRQQVSLMMANSSPSLEARHVHRELACRYGRLIDAERGPAGWMRPAPLRGAETAA